MSARERFVRIAARTSSLAPVGHRGQSGLEDRDGVADPARVDEPLPELRAGAADAGSIPELLVGLERLAHEALGLLVVASQVRRTGARRSRSACSAGSDVTCERLLGEGDGLVVRAERGGSLGGAAQREACLGRDRIGLGARGRGLVGRQVVGRQDAGQLLVAERLEVAGRGEVAGAPVAPGERAVGDLADERLDEARTGRAPASGDPTSSSQQLAPDERRAAAARGRPRPRPVTAARPARVKVWPRTAASWRRRRSVGSSASRREAMSERSVSGTASVAEVADRPVASVDALEAAVGDEHPDGLDGVERDAVGAGEDRPRRRAPGSPGTKPVEQLAHRLRRTAARGRAA